MGCYEDLRGTATQINAPDRPGDSWGEASPLTTSLPFTLKSTGKENSNKNEVKGSKFETARHLKSGRIR